jgi:hypothetical protein
VGFSPGRWEESSSYVLNNHRKSGWNNNNIDSIDTVDTVGTFDTIDTIWRAMVLLQ